MATISSYVNGSTAHIPNGGVSPHERAKRSTVKGWTKEAVRRHTKWLYSIDTAGLSGHGYAVTLTMRQTPEDAQRFHALRRSWVRRIERMGSIRLHWVIEWQRRGTPHMHCAVYFERSLTKREQWQLTNHWVELSEDYGSKHGSQTCKEITGPEGWLQYLSKHAARGVKHYQRNGKPAGWEKTGRLWGHGGTWSEVDPLKFDISRAAYFRFRRLVRSHFLADARAEEDSAVRARRIGYLRRMLKCNDRQLSEVRGVSEWIDQSTLMDFLGLLDSEGYQVRQLAD